MRKIILLLFPLMLAILSCSLPFLPDATPDPTQTPDVPTLPVVETAQATITPTPEITDIPVEELPPAAIVFSEKQIADEQFNPMYKIEAHYPYLEGVPRSVVFNQGVEEYINSAVDSFRMDIEQLEGEWRQVQSFFSIDYTITFQSNELVSVLFDVSYLVAGAAHPGSDVHSLNYDVAMGRFLELPALFIAGSDFLDDISVYCTDELEQSGMLAWPEGLEPILTNFNTWNIQQDSLLITFPPYQVAPGAAGILQVEMPLQQLSGVIRPDGLLAPLIN